MFSQLRSSTSLNVALLAVAYVTSACSTDSDGSIPTVNGGGGASADAGNGSGSGARSNAQGGRGTDTGGRSGSAGASAGGSPSCPTSCDDGVACTIDGSQGDAAACTLTCQHDPITACGNGDGCCPAGCTTSTDSDCTATTLSALPENRRISWDPGIPGGIPERTTVCATVNAAMFGNDSTDATQAIQSAIDGCAEGQVVRLPAGTYRTNRTLAIRKGIVLRGDGPTQTKITLTAASVDAVIAIGTEGPNNAAGVAINSGYTKGSTELVLSNASSFDVGDVVLIDQLDDPTVVANGDCTIFKRNQGGYRSIGQLVEVTAKNGNTVTTSSPLYYNYSSELRPELSPTNPNGNVKYAGVEDLYATRSSDFGGQGYIFHFMTAAYSWLKNVEGFKVSGRHVALDPCFRCEVVGSYFHDAWNNEPGGTGYGIHLHRHSSDNLIENNIIYLLNVPLGLSVSGGGNVVAYNYIDDATLPSVPNWQMADISTHCAFPYMELVEGNWTGQFAADNVHGGAGYITLFRNNLTGHHRTLMHSGNTYSVNLAANSLYMNVVGNVLWQPNAQGVPDAECGDPRGLYHLGEDGDGCNIDARVADTLIRHGNFDYMRNSVAWDPNISDHALPPSLYLRGKPAFFGDRPWPLVDPEGSQKVGVLPAKERYDTELAP